MTAGGGYPGFRWIRYRVGPVLHLVEYARRGGPLCALMDDTGQSSTDSPNVMNTDLAMLVIRNWSALQIETALRKRTPVGLGGRRVAVDNIDAISRFLCNAIIFDLRRSSGAGAHVDADVSCGDASSCGCARPARVSRTADHKGAVEELNNEMTTRPVGKQSRTGAENSLEVSSKFISWCLL